MFRKNRNYYENKDKREKANYDALTPTQRQIYNYINSARLELGGEYVIMQSNGLSIDCYVSTDKLKVEVTSSLTIFNYLHYFFGIIAYDFFEFPLGSERIDFLPVEFPTVYMSEPTKQGKQASRLRDRYVASLLNIPHSSAQSKKDFLPKHHLLFVEAKPHKVDRSAIHLPYLIIRLQVKSYLVEVCLHSGDCFTKFSFVGIK